jgi:hypothetical protein
MNRPTRETRQTLTGHRRDDLDFAMMLFNSNWNYRHAATAYWRAVHRHYTREAITAIRRITGRRRKRLTFPAIDWTVYESSI